MSDHERGAYTPPTDSPLSFDARQPVRGSRPFPFTLVIAVLVLVALAAAIFVFYRSGVRQAGQPPHTVGEPVGEMKVPPPAEAQPQDPAAGLQIYKEDQPDAAHPQFTSPPEQPQPRDVPPAVVIAPPPAAAPTTPVGGAVVQIGAVSSTALADKAWNDAVAVAPGLAAGKGKSVEKIDKNGGTLYRTAVTGFASRDAASAFCAKLKAAGKSCFVR